MSRTRKMERVVVKRLLLAALAAGYAVSIDNGEEVKKFTTGTRSREIMKDMFSVDEETLILSKNGKASRVQLVYGNDGWDVINDYGVSLEEVVQATEPLVGWLMRLSIGSYGRA